MNHKNIMFIYIYIHGSQTLFTNFRTCMHLANLVSWGFFKIKIKCVQPNMRLNHIHTDTIKKIKIKLKKSCTYLVQILPLTALVLCPLEKYVQTRQITTTFCIIYWSLGPYISTYYMAINIFHWCLVTSWSFARQYWHQWQIPGWLVHLLGLSRWPVVTSNVSVTKTGTVEEFV